MLEPAAMACGLRDIDLHLHHAGIHIAGYVFTGQWPQLNNSVSCTNTSGRYGVIKVEAFSHQAPKIPA